MEFNIVNEKPTSTNSGIIFTTNYLGDLKYNKHNSLKRV